MTFWERRLIQAIQRQARAELVGDPSEVVASRDLVGRVLSEFNALSHVAGALRVHSGRGDAAPAQLPNVPFREALAQLAKRNPVLARSAKRVAELYRRGPYLAFSKAATQSVADRVKERLMAAMTEGHGRSAAAQTIADTADWAPSYARMVLQTNATGAETRGRMATAKRLGSRFPVAEFLTAGDINTRRGRRKDGGENHGAMHGFRASVHWPGWKVWTPPLGYGCRCTLRLVSVPELEMDGQWNKGHLSPALRNPAVPHAARKHPDF